MEFPEFRRKFKKFVEAVYLDDDVRLSFLQSLCVGRAANSIKGLGGYMD